MPVVEREDARLYYEVGESGAAASESEAVPDAGPVVFVGEAGYAAWQWSWQYAAVAGPFEAVVTDLRGSGRSETTAESFDVATLAADLAAVLADHGARRVHLVGAGLGAMVALECARESGRVRSLVVFGSALSGDAFDEGMLSVLGNRGPDSLAPCFSEAFFERQREVVVGVEKWRDDDAPDAVRDAQVAALRAYDCDTPYELTLPTLVCHGAADPVVPQEAGRALADALPNGEFVSLPGRHLAHVESSRVANDELVGFLGR
ncbi:alpha/beta fold hydrolase [Halomarina oriensis]|uniref:Alpha/beta fold hydrolase n=1 Tax=Halomarina oriensis TaxID=671145 RepID=A0A6B0GIF8_9EURY|nr:alpha/beta hydrolase [Halomarina oriensis]MWG34410.1 alpha/beta fold hydrolase [Halomarina oriensis]